MSLIKFIFVATLCVAAFKAVKPAKNIFEKAKFNRSQFPGTWYTVFVSPVTAPADCLVARVSLASLAEVLDRKRSVSYLMPPVDWDRVAFKMEVNSTAEGTVLMLQETDEEGVMLAVPSAKMLGGRAYYGERPLVRFAQYGRYLALRESVFNGTTMLARSVPGPTEAMAVARELGIATSGRLACPYTTQAPERTTRRDYY